MPTKTEAVKELISFAVCCMFGRYTLDKDGLIFAGGTWDMTKYHNYMPDKMDLTLTLCYIHFMRKGTKHWQSIITELIGTCSAR